MCWFFRLTNAYRNATWIEDMERSTCHSLNGNFLNPRFLRSCAIEMKQYRFCISQKSLYHYLSFNMLYQAAAYYYHGLMLDKGLEPSCHVSAVCCFLAAEELLLESKKACLSFCLASPVTRLAVYIPFSFFWSCCFNSISSKFEHSAFSLCFCYHFCKISSTLGCYEAFTSENSRSCFQEVSNVWIPLGTGEVRHLLTSFFLFLISSLVSLVSLVAFRDVWLKFPLKYLF